MFSTTKWTVSEAEKEAAVKRMQARKAESEGGEAKRQKVDTFASPGAGQPTIADAGDDVCDSTSITNMSSSAATNSPNSANDLALKPKGAKAPVAKAPAPRTTRNSTAAVATAPATTPVAVLTHDFILNAAQAAEVNKPLPVFVDSPHLGAVPAHQASGDGFTGFMPLDIMRYVEYIAAHEHSFSPGLHFDACCAYTIWEGSCRIQDWVKTRPGLQTMAPLAHSVYRIEITKNGERNTLFAVGSEGICFPASWRHSFDDKSCSGVTLAVTVMTCNALGLHWLLL